MPQTEIRVFCGDADSDPPLLTWLAGLRKTERKVYAKCLAAIESLEREGFSLQPPTSAPLRDGIHELRIRFRSVNYRILYCFCGKNVACLSHGITKEDVVPDKEIDLAVSRKNLVDNDLERFTKEWTVH